MAEIVFNNVTKVYKGGVTAVKELNLEVGNGEFIVLVGPSGCGKTTALRMIAGLEEITGGEIMIEENVVNDMDPSERDIAMVFQNYALYPHMTVYDNIAFPLQCQKVPKAEIQERVQKVAKLLSLSEYLNRKPRTLSGGQRQRVAMGRALIREPKAFLMDEPLSNLDAKLRVQMRAEISSLQAKLGITTVYVTHDQVEAMTMGTRIAVMRLGVLQQYGTPEEVYKDPANIFVASFIGSPSMNFVKARINDNGGSYSVEFGEQSIELSDEALQGKPALLEYAGSDVILGIRPEHLVIDGTEGPTFKAHVVRDELLGAEQLIYLTLEAESVAAEEILEAMEADKTTIDRLESERESKQVSIIIRADSAQEITVGKDVNVSVRPSCLHFFTMDNGKTIKT